MLRAFGLTLELQHLRDGTDFRGEQRVVPVAMHGADAADPETAGLRIGWPDYADFTVTSDPARIDVRLTGASELDASLALVLSVLPLALPQFGLEPLHGSVVVIDGRVTLIVGASHSGKSTTTAHLLHRGHQFASDDTSAVDEKGTVWPGAPFVAVRDRSLVDLIPGDVVAPYDDKVVVRPHNVHRDPAPVAAAVVLAPGPNASLHVDTLNSRDAFTTLMGHIRAPGALPEERTARQLTVVSKLAEGRVGLATYDKACHPAADVAAAVERWIINDRAR